MTGAIRTDAEAAYGGAEEVDRMLLDLQSIKRRGEPPIVPGLLFALPSIFTRRYRLEPVPLRLGHDP